MAVVIGVNSWAGIAEADSYLYYRPDSAAWFNLPSLSETQGQETKEAYLLLAYSLLIYHTDYFLTANMTDPAVKEAQIEFAFYLCTEYAKYKKQMYDLYGEDKIQSENQSKWSITYFQERFAEGPLPFSVSSRLSTFGSNCAVINLGGD